MLTAVALFAIGAITGVHFHDVLSWKRSEARAVDGDLVATILSDQRTVRLERMLLPRLGPLSPRERVWQVDVLDDPLTRAAFRGDLRWFRSCHSFTKVWRVDFYARGLIIESDSGLEHLDVNVQTGGVVCLGHL